MQLAKRTAKPQEFWFTTYLAAILRLQIICLVFHPAEPSAIG